MISFSTSTDADIPQLNKWIANDPYHFHLGKSEWWLTGVEGSLLAFVLMDERGPLTFVRIDTEGEYVRLHTQFGPRSEVSQRRLVVGMIQCMEKLIELYQADAFCKGMIFNSVSLALIVFMCKRLGFKSVGDNDFRLDFEVH